MATVTVSSNPSTSGNTLTVYFTTDATNITNIQLTNDGSNYISATSFTSSTATFNVSTWDNGTYSNCKLKVIYTETIVSNNFTVTYNLTNCISSNNVNSVSEGGSYSTTISPDTNYEMNSISVTMGGSDITSSAVSGNDISISNVTGNIAITATATAIVTVTTYTITNNLSNCSTSNSKTSINKGSSYSATISPNEGYTITSITVTMGGINVTNTVVNGKNITISNVTGDIVITVKTALLSTDGHTITYNLTNCTSLSDQTDITSGEWYYTTITANSGYVLTGIIVTMNGIDITTDVVDKNNNIHITSVTGDVVITATAKVQGATVNTYRVTYNLTNCTSSNTNSAIEENTSYRTIITANNNYTLGNIIVTMDGTNITSTAVSGNNINISRVTGNIVIAAEATETSTPGGGTGGGGTSTNILPPLAQWTKSSGITAVTTSGDYSATITSSAWWESISTTVTGLSAGDSVTLSCSDISNSIRVDLTDSGGTSEGALVTGVQSTTVTIGNYTPYTVTIWMSGGNRGTISDISLIKNSSSGSGTGGSTPGGGSSGSGGSSSSGSSTYTVTYNLDKCTTDSTQTSISSGNYYYTNVIANTGYTISNITVTMGGIDVTSSYVSNNAVYVTNVTGNIVVTATAIANSSSSPGGSGGSGGSGGGTSTYTVTYNLSNCYTDSTQKTVSQGDYYYTNVMANSGYTLNNVTVTMGGVNVTSSAVDSNNVVYITNVTGDIVINATATSSSSSNPGGSPTTYYNVSYNLTYCSSSSSVSSIASGNSYYTYISPNTNYTLSNISVTMGGVNITSSAVSGNNINISNVTGNIVITATASYTQNVTYYNVIYNLTRCSSSSSMSSVASGNSYYTNITANTNCTMGSITVTMGGTNITSSAVSGNNINISSVTGNIVITATATSNVSQVYTNPTVTFNYGKAIVTQDGYTETFDAAYTQNTGYSGYSSSKSVTDSDGYTYYLTLSNTNAQNSRFKINNKYPVNGGWMSTTNSSGEAYTFGKYPLCYYNNGSWTYSMTNVNNSVPSALLTKALQYFNASFPALNLSANGGTTSTIELASYDETWAGVTTRYSKHFEIQLNSRVMTRDYGAYGSSTTATRKWISTTVHEMGHILGLIDNASHLPSIYDYSRDKTKCLFLQPNDLYALKYFLKNNFGVEITNYEMPEEEVQNDIVPTMTTYNLRANSDEEDCEFNFDYLYYQDDELEEVSDVIVKCKLKYKSTDTLDIHNDEDNNLYFDYNIYEIEVEETVKGDLTNNLLKIHISENLDVNEDKTYKLYLKQFDNTPCSLVNIMQGIVEL